jgi:hypothetical protein
VSWPQIRPCGLEEGAALFEALHGPRSKELMGVVGARALDYVCILRPVLGVVRSTVVMMVFWAWMRDLDDARRMLWWNCRNVCLGIVWMASCSHERGEWTWSMFKAPVYWGRLFKSDANSRKILCVHVSSWYVQRNEVMYWQGFKRRRVFRTLWNMSWYIWVLDVSIFGDDALLVIDLERNENWEVSVCGRYFGVILNVCVEDDVQRCKVESLTGTFWS